MNYRILFFLSATALFAQAPAPPANAPSPDTVLATVDGKNLTYGDLARYLDGLGPERKAQALNQDRRELVKQFAMLNKLAGIAETEKLDQKSPYKEALEANRRQLLMQALIDQKYANTVITADDQEKFYQANRDRYTQVKLQVIYLGFVSDADAKQSAGKYRTEEQAKAQIAKLRTQIHSREDFVRLVKQYSEDQSSKEKDGEYGTLKKSDNLPDNIKSVVFTLKEADVSEPVQQRNGFYLFRADSVGLRPYGEVKDDIYNELKETRVREWFTKTQDGISFEIKNQEFFGGSPRPPAKQ